MKAFSSSSIPSSSLPLSAMMTSTLLILLTTLLSVDAAVTVPTCRLSRPLYAGDLRTTDKRGPVIDVFGDWVNYVRVPDARDSELMNHASNFSNSQAALDPAKKLTVDRVFLFNDTDASRIAIFFNQMPNYWLANVNDTVEINLPPEFFWSGIACPRFTFKILPSPGTIDTSFLPVGGVSEIDINDGDVTFDLVVGFDRFTVANAWFSMPTNFTFIITQVIPPPTENPNQNIIRFTVHRNESYNPPVGKVDKLVVIFHKYMMSSGVAPIIGDGISETEVSIDFKGVQPVASVIYQTAAAAMLSEDVWDGKAWAILVLKGDTFIQNETLWNITSIQPELSAIKPIAPYSFDFFLPQPLGSCNVSESTNCMRPNINITSARTVNISFPPLVGFAFPGVVDQMLMNELGRVTNEQQTIAEVPFRCLRVKDSSPIIYYGGDPYRNNSDGTIGISEVDVRRTGFNVSLTLKYNVWVNPPSAPVVRDMIKSFSLPGSSLLRFTETVAYVVDRLRLDIVVPAQTSYDISVDETMNVTVVGTMSETRRLMLNNSGLFNISQFTGASTCSISSSPAFIFESDVRNMTGGQLNVTMSIETGTDTFCINPQSQQDLRQAITLTTGPGQPLPIPGFEFISNNSKNITFVVFKDPNFEITGNVYFTINLPASIMCSIEICVSEQSGASANSRLQLPIGATSGKLIGTMPRVSEEYMRTQTVRSVIEFLGDAFNLGTIGSTRGSITLQPTVDPVDAYGRGFIASFPQNVRRISIDGNLTRGDFALSPNASYDIVNEETISFTILSTRTASQLEPDSQIVPLRVYPLLGILNVVYPNLTQLAAPPPPAPSTTVTLGPNETTTSTTTATSTTATTIGTTTTTMFNNTNTTNATTIDPSINIQPWFMNVTESEILNGNITINLTLANDRFNTAILPSTIRAQLDRHTVLQPSGIDSNKGVVFGDAAFIFDRNEFTMSIRFQKAPQYDITEPESFTISINGSVLISQASPLQNQIRINVQPDPGRLSMSGDALVVSSFDIVNGDRNFTITLDGDKFVPGVDSIFNYSEICIVTKGACQISTDLNTRRSVTIIYDPFADFFISRNTTYTIKLHPYYFDANVVPIGDTNVTVFLSGGKIEWFMTFARVSEDEVRSGSYTNLAADKPVAKASISGDKFAAKDEVRRALAESVECTSADVNAVGIDPYGFCARARALFGSIFFKVNDERVVDVVLQPDDQFDIYAEELVRFVAGGGATQSRLKPILASEEAGVKSGEMTIYPTKGQYFISTSFVYITEQDISSPALASRMKLTISLYGERWLSNVTRVVELVVSQMNSDVGDKEINGWNFFRSSIFPALTAGSIDDSGRLLELQFVAAPDYDVFNPETITITVPPVMTKEETPKLIPAAVLSQKLDLAPRLASVQKGFTIDTVGGILSGAGYLTTINVIKATKSTEEDRSFVLVNKITPTVKIMQSTGFNITLQLTRDSWNEVTLYQDFSLVYTAFSSDKTPQEEGNGFQVYKDRIIVVKNPLIPVPGNSSHRNFLLSPVPQYDLINPERIRIDMVLGWTQQGGGGKATAPAFFEILIMPEFPYVEASVKSYIDLRYSNSPLAKAYIENWKKTVAEKLAVIPSRIDIISLDKEWMAPDASPYFRIRFRVTDISDPDIPYDNTLTRLFTSWDREFLEKNFNTSFAFYNASPPATQQWLTLEGAGGIPDNYEAVGISLSAIIYFVVGIILAIIIIILIRRYNQGRHKNGLNWGESEGRQKADARFTDSHETEERNFDKAAELLFAGQRELVPYLADDDAARAAKDDAAKDALARKHGIVRQHTASTVTGNPSDKGYRLRQHAATGDGRDELAFFDIPDDIYSGQSKIQKRATDADVGMSLIDRMVTTGTDHSTRISRNGQSRLNNITELMTPREIEMSRRGQSARHDYGSPTEQRTRDPVLFGSERRINDLLSKVGGNNGSANSNTEYMTSLKTQLVDSGVTPINDKDAANKGPKLWSDTKADEIVLPPHLVGKVSRFRGAASTSGK